ILLWMSVSATASSVFLVSDNGYSVKFNSPDDWFTAAFTAYGDLVFAGLPALDAVPNPRDIVTSFSGIIRPLPGYHLVDVTSSLSTNFKGVALFKTDSLVDGHLFNQQ